MIKDHGAESYRRVEHFDGTLLSLLSHWLPNAQ